MKISLTKMAHRLIWVLTVFILSVYITFDAYIWGKYTSFAASILIVLLSVCLNKGRIRIRLGEFHGFMILFAFYCMLNALWAFDARDAMQQGWTMIQILICAEMLCIYYRDEGSIEKLLSVVMWAGYAVALYTISEYGLKVITGGSRIKNDFANVNMIGMTVAVSCVIQVHEWLYGRKRKIAFLLIPGILVISATQSRKALLLLLLGVFGVFIMREQQGQKLLNKMVKMAWLLLGAIVAVILVYSLPIFEGVRDRMNSMIAGVLGTGETDGSTEIRLSMVELGIEWFWKYPIGGIGIGCAHIVAAQDLGMNVYLHNNFVELLCGGGLVGFLIYYSMYAYLFMNLLKYRRADRKHFEIGLVWLTLMLIMDYGVVSYNAKEQWFYLMVHFLNIHCMKKKKYGE